VRGGEGGGWARWGRYRSAPGFPVPKRMLDLSLLILSAPVWIPVLGMVALLVRWRLGSPVFFRQDRPALAGRVFRMTKFRTMTDARDEGGALLSDAERLPPFGKWLRSTSLDELPELLCVLKGEMSLVGPRPLLTEYLRLYSREQARRHELPPGLTGWAQIHGRNALSWDERFRHDVWYVDHAGIGLDVWIILSTVGKVIRRDGIAAEGEATMPAFRGSPERGSGRNPEVAAGECGGR